MKNPVFRLFAVAAMTLSGAMLPFNTDAAPYASDLTNNAGVISFRLNENADNVKIISGGGAVTNDLGAGVKGLTTTNLGIVGIFKVVVSRSAAAGYTQLSADNYQVDGIYVNKFEQPRGLAINKNPASPSFGRIFVGNARTANTATLVRTTVDGIYMFNSDNTPALDTHITPRTAGLGFTSGTGDPNRLNIGRDDNMLYICDFSDPTGGLYVTDLDVVNGTNVLGAVGGPPGTTDNHGSTYGAAIEGSLANSNLKIFTIDEDLTPLRSVWRYDVGGSTLPYTGAQVGPLSTAPIANFTGDLVKGGDNNYLYFSQNRSSGTEVNGPGVRIFDENGTVITDSQTESRTYLNNPTAADLLRNTVALDLSPDGKTLAVLQGVSFGRVLFVPLVNGVFNFAGTNSFLVGSLSDNNRDVAYDAAGNVAVINTASEWLRIFSRGGSTEATTGSDGTFTIGAPATVVSVTAATPTANEQGQTAGVFTFTRAGDTSGSLTINVAWSGTASNGVDYPLLGNTITFAANATSTNISIVPVDDSIAEFSETVVAAVAAGSGYGIGTPASATVTILDNEAAVIDVIATQPILLESYANSKGRFQVARRGLLTSALTVNLSYTGSAVRTVDFNGPLSVDLAAGATTTNLFVTPINDLTYEGDETIIIGAAAGTGYTASTNVGTITIIDDEYPTKPVLFTDAFDTDSSPNWIVNFPGGEAFADFNFDYSTLGIPSAPYSTGGTTRGVKFTVNTTEGLVNGISISPIGQNFTDDYRLEFDMWINVNGPLPAGGTGSTEFFNAGIGTTGDHPNYFAGASDGAWFSADGEGGTGAVTGDYNAYYGFEKASDGSGVYVAGTTGGPRDNFHPYYALWGGDSAPALQQANYAQQTGATEVGTFGMAWHRGAITKIGEVVTWSIDGRNMAVITNGGSTTFTSTGNIFVGYHDQFASVSDNADLSFGLVDNVRVLNLSAVTVPSITSISVINGGTEVQIDFTGTVGGSFTLLSSGTVDGTYLGTAATFSTLGSGSYRFVTAVNGAQRFYRIQGN